MYNYRSISEFYFFYLEFVTGDLEITSIGEIVDITLATDCICEYSLAKGQDLNYLNIIERAKFNDMYTSELNDIPYLVTHIMIYLKSVKIAH